MSERAEHVLIVGGAGYLGSVLSRQLLASDRRVTVLDTLLFGEDSVTELKGRSDFTLVQGDFTDISVASAIVESGVDAVVLLAALVGEPACDRDPRRAVDVNYLGALNLARTCCYFGVPRFLFASTDSAYGIQEGIMYEESPLEPISLYARLKMQAETEIRALAGASFFPTILRMATIYGPSPRMRFDLVINVLSKHAWANGKIKVFGGEQWRPLVHVEDAARAYVMCLEEQRVNVGGKVFNVGDNDQNYQVGTLGRLVAEVFDNIQIETVPQTPDLRDYRVNFDRISNDIGYRVEHSVVDGIRGIRTALEAGLIADPEDRKHYNA